MSQEQYFRNLVKNLLIQIQLMQNLGLTYDNIVKNCFNAKLYKILASPMVVRMVVEKNMDCT